MKTGQFHIYAASTIDEGIQILTGIPAGERRKDGTYPEDSINYLVNNKLVKMAERLKGFLSDEKKEEKQETTGAQL